MKRSKNLIILAAICLVCVIGMVLALTLGQKTVVNFEPPPFDSGAVTGTPSDMVDETYGEVDAKAYKLSISGKPTVKDGAAFLWLTNPESNQVWIKVRILDTTGKMLGESGLLRPGEYVQSVVLTTPPLAEVNTTLLIMAYEPDTYHSMGNVRLQTSLTIEK
ncbi:MAG TPA: hypothetical protein VJY37_03820 [Anaerovoracaceae bacterium]|nr:hypothetical protein [Anaerovoracaceae bacterium]